MSACDEFLISFGPMTKEQEKLLKKSLIYHNCLFVDSVNNLFMVVRQEFIDLIQKIKIIFKSWRTK